MSIFTDSDTIGVDRTEEEHVQKVDNCWAFTMASLAHSAQNQECNSCKNSAHSDSCIGNQTHKQIRETFSNLHFNNANTHDVSYSELRDYLKILCIDHNKRNVCKWEGLETNVMEWDKFLAPTKVQLGSGVGILICFSISETVRTELYKVSKKLKGIIVKLSDLKNIKTGSDIIHHAVWLTDIHGDKSIQFKDWNEAGDDSGIIHVSYEVLKKYFTLTFAATIKVEMNHAVQKLRPTPESKTEDDWKFGGNDVVIAGSLVIGIALVLRFLFSKK